jgi:hypothetical protein
VIERPIRERELVVGVCVREAEVEGVRVVIERPIRERELVVVAPSP